MSASLVGSEMCIRDSIGETGPLEDVFDDVDAEMDYPMGLLESDSQEAVSYTHLTLPTICSV
eukprot:14486672-Alexandrium_andersonii.AAC.1